MLSYKLQGKDGKASEADALLYQRELVAMTSTNLFMAALH